MGWGGAGPLSHVTGQPGMSGTRAQTQLLPCLSRISIEAKQRACCWNFVQSRQLEVLRNERKVWGPLGQRPPESMPPFVAFPRS